MWLYMSKTSSNTVVLCDYQSTRSSSFPKNFLVDFKEFLQKDGYTRYNSIADTTSVYCLAHIRRYSHKIIVDLDEEAQKIPEQ